MSKEFQMLMVVVVWVAFMGGFFWMYRKRQTKKARRNNLKARAIGSIEATSPQMGFPVEQGITGWQEFKPAPRPVDGFEQINELIKRVQSAPPLNPQKVVRSSEGEDPWARAIAEGLVHRHIPPSQH